VNLEDLSKGWERRDVSDEEYVAALRQRVEELERIVNAGGLIYWTMRAEAAEAEVARLISSHR
jgi:hypothetical protein